MSRHRRSVESLDMSQYITHNQHQNNIHNNSHISNLDPTYLSYQHNLHTAPIPSPIPMLHSTHSSQYNDILTTDNNTQQMTDFQAAQSPTHVFNTNTGHQNGYQLQDDYTPTMLANGHSLSSPIPQSHTIQSHHTASMHTSHTYQAIPHQGLMQGYTVPTTTDWRTNDEYTNTSSGSNLITQPYYPVHMDPYQHKIIHDTVDSDADINPLNSGSSSERVRVVRKKRKFNSTAAKKLDLEDPVDLYNNIQHVYEKADSMHTSHMSYIPTPTDHPSYNRQLQSSTAAITLPSKHITTTSPSIHRTESGKTIPEYALQQYQSRNTLDTHHTTDLNFSSISQPQPSPSPDSESIESTDDEIDDNHNTVTPSINRRVSNSQTSINRADRKPSKKRRHNSDDDVDDSESEFELSSPATSSRKRRNRKSHSNSKTTSNTKLHRSNSSASSHNKTPRSNSKSVPPIGNDAIEPTVLCEQCHTLHTGWYGGGRFCTPKCARRFSIISRHSKRKSISK